MTVNDIFLNYTIPLMGEKRENTPAYSEQVIPVINMVICDCFNINNALREKRGKEKLTEIPIMKTTADTIPYENEIVINVIPYGVGTRLTIDEEEPNKTGFLEHNYVSRFNMYNVAAATEIIDYYGEAE